MIYICAYIKYVYIYIYIVRMYASRSRTVFSRRDGRSKLNSPCTCSRTCARPRRIIHASIRGPHAMHMRSGRGRRACIYDTATHIRRARMHVWPPCMDA